MASTNTGITVVDTPAGGCHNHGVPRVFASWADLARLAAAPIGLAVAVGALAQPVLTGARGLAGWRGEAIPAPDAKAAIEALQNRLRPGDVVLVKASKSAGLWEVADGLLAEVDQ